MFFVSDTWSSSFLFSFFFKISLGLILSSLILLFLVSSRFSLLGADNTPSTYRYIILVAKILKCFCTGLRNNSLFSSSLESPPPLLASANPEYPPGRLQLSMVVPLSCCCLWKLWSLCSCSFM